MLTLLLGRDWTANRAEILRRISADVDQKRENRILLVPELISHDMERRLAKAAGHTASRYAQVLSFTRMGRRISELAGSSGQECLDEGGRIVAMAAAARQLSSKLKAYAALETKPEFLTQLVDAVDECKRCCITPQDLSAAAEQSTGTLSQKLEELSLLLQSYDAICSQGKRDPRDQMTWVLEQLEEMDFAENHVLYVDGFPDFTRQNLAILEHFIRHSPHVTISLNCDRPDSVLMAFEKASDTARQILQCAARCGVQVQVETVAERADALQSVRRGLFQGSTACDGAIGDHLRLVHTNSISEECAAAAERICQLVRQGARYRDISLVCTDLQSYTPVLRMVMKKCGIPMYLAGTEEVLRSGVVTTVLFALEAALGGLEQRAVMRYLRSVLSPLDSDRCDLVENYAVVWAISGNGWLKAWNGHPQGLAGQWDEASERLLEQLNQARALAIDPLLRLRESLRSAKTLSHQVLALYAFLEDIRFAERLGQLSDDMEAAGDLRSAQILNQLWEILLNALEQLHDVLGNTAWEEDTFPRLLKLLLRQYDVGTIPPVLDSVHVGNISAMRCQQQKHLILLGAQEGSLPGYGGSTGLLTDQERTELRRMGVPLTGGAMDGLQAEFAEIYGVFCGAEESITLCCSAVQPSFIYRRLATMAGQEQQPETYLLDALCSADAAGAYLARFGAVEAAATLGAERACKRILRRKNYSMGTVEKKHIHALYGKKLRLSASQVDRQAECRLSYFLQYGLCAKERKEATVDPMEFGTYVHAVLEQTARDVMALGGFRSVSLEQTLAIAAEHSATYVDQRFCGLDSQRMEYLFRRNMLEMEMVVQELWRELKASEYIPTYFEMNFGMDCTMDAIDIQGSTMDAVLRGKVDRVDTWSRGESTYFRVVDYKTGKRELDYCDLYNGVGLQMLLYLFALEDAGDSVIGGKRVSAGVQYFPARAPYVTVDGTKTPEEAQKERQKLWKRSGLLLADSDSLEAMDPSEDMAILCCKRKKDGTLTGDVADRAQMKVLKKYLRRLLKNMVDEIASGNVTPNPYTRGTSHNACTFCPYGAVCHPDSVSDRRNYKTMSQQSFWESVEKEVGHG